MRAAIATAQLSFFETPCAPAKPVFKWAGGKRWLAPVLGPAVLSLLRAHRGARYFEPFLGGGAVAFWLGGESMVLADIESPVVAAYETIRREWRAVATALDLLVRDGTDRASYLRVRESAPEAGPMAAARIIFLNRLCFNGLYRNNSRGCFNVPYGDYRRPSFPTPDQLSALSAALVNAQLSCADFETTLAECGHGDVVFADPPYHSPSSGFRSYHQRPFTERDHERLALALRAAWRRGATVLSTNSDTDYIRRLYSWAQIASTRERRAINSVGRGRAGVGCVLVTAPRLDLDHVVLGLST